jgi:hypothetical protein
MVWYAVKAVMVYLYIQCSPAIPSSRGSNEEWGIPHRMPGMEYAGEACDLVNTRSCGYFCCCSCALRRGSYFRARAVRMYVDCYTGTSEAHAFGSSTSFTTDAWECFRLNRNFLPVQLPLAVVRYPREIPRDRCSAL